MPCKVSFVLHKFDRGGSLRVAAYLARGFTDRGMDVELVMVTDQGEVDQIIADIAGAKVPIRYLGSWSGPRPLDLIRGLPRLARHLRSRTPDVIIAGANNVALASAAARWMAGLNDSRLFLKTTNPIASSRHTGVVKWFRRWTYRKVFLKASGVWTLSRSENEEMRDAFPEFTDLFRAVFNPYVTNSMLGNESEPGQGVPSQFILSVARLTAQKRLERLIEAFALVRDKNVVLKILGEGEQRSRLAELIDRLGLEGRVIMPGYVANVADAYASARMLVLTSDYEGLPAVVLEAMAANCPVLSTDCFPAAREIMDAAEGCEIIEALDAPTLAAIIDAHLTMPRPTGLRKIAQRYSIENGVASHLEALRASTSGGTGRGHRHKRPLGGEL